MDPPVSVPIAMKQPRAAKVAPDPPDDPPGMCATFHGLPVVGVAMP
jgi:hypothetical protein